MPIDLRSSHPHRPEPDSDCLHGRDRARKTSFSMIRSGRLRPRGGTNPSDDATEGARVDIPHRVSDLITYHVAGFDRIPNSEELECIMTLQSVGLEA